MRESAITSFSWRKLKELFLHLSKLFLQYRIAFRNYSSVNLFLGMIYIWPSGHSQKSDLRRVLFSSDPAWVRHPWVQFHYDVVIWAMREHFNIWEQLSHVGTERSSHLEHFAYLLNLNNMVLPTIETRFGMAYNLCQDIRLSFGVLGSRL